jgi:uncharacterized protein (TIGR02145 family)
MKSGKTAFNFFQWRGILFPAVLLSFLVIQSCQKDEQEREILNDLHSSKSLAFPNSGAIIYYGPETFTIVSKEMVNVTHSLANPDFGKYENFVLKVQNGSGGKTKVTKLRISIDGVVLVTYSDFRGNKNEITKKITSLTPSSKLEVSLEGSRGRFVKIQIECSLKQSTITDIEGNKYKTVFICGKWWMAENLRATKFNDGTPIFEANSNSDWIDYYTDRKPAYCWYNNDPSNKAEYGALYNYAVGEGNVCPAGWHIPSDYEYYGMSLCFDPDSRMSSGTISDISGAMLKEAGTTHWQSPNTGATNSSGFTALPGGRRNIDGTFVTLHTEGSWWSDKGLSFVGVVYNDTYLSFSEGGNEYGRSIRCVKDE